MDNTILGYNFLTHWNPNIDWVKGLITPSHSHLSRSIVLFPGPNLNTSPQPVAPYRNSSLLANLQAPNLLPSSLLSLTYPLTKTEANNRSVQMGCSVDPFEVNFFQEAPDDIESILPLIPDHFHKYPDLLSKFDEVVLQPRSQCDHKIKLTGPPPSKGGVH